MSSSCAVQGVVKLKSEWIPKILKVYNEPDQGFDADPSKNKIERYLFGVNVSNYIQTHFSEKASDFKLNNIDFDTGILKFISGFSSYDLNDFISLLDEISEAYILYSIYENSWQLHNEMAAIKHIDELKNYINIFNNPDIITSDLPLSEFKIDGKYYRNLLQEVGFYPKEEFVWQYSKA